MSDLISWTSEGKVQTHVWANIHGKTRIPTNFLLPLLMFTPYKIWARAHFFFEVKYRIGTVVSKFSLPVEWGQSVAFIGLCNIFMEIDLRVEDRWGSSVMRTIRHSGECYTHWFGECKGPGFSWVCLPVGFKAGTHLPPSKLSALNLSSKFPMKTLAFSISRRNTN